MKKLLLILVVLGVAAPLYAGHVDFTVTDNVQGSCTISYNVADPCDSPPVAIGLDIEVTGTDPNQDGPIHTVTVDSAFFEIFMDAAYDMESDPCTPPYTYGAGTPVANVAVRGQATLPSSHFSLSMGGLGGPEKPLMEAPMSGDLVTLFSDGGSAGTLGINAIRGGVIDADGNPMTTNVDPAKNGQAWWKITECFPGAHAHFAGWKNRGKPRCWCSSHYQPGRNLVPPVIVAGWGSNYQCRGDADSEYSGKAPNLVYVNLGDLEIFNGAWMKDTTHPDWNANKKKWICADFNHAFTGKDPVFTYVTLADLTIFNGGWQEVVGDTHFTDNPCF